MLIFFVIWVFEKRIKKIEGKARSAIIQNHKKKVYEKITYRFTGDYQYTAAGTTNSGVKVLQG